MTDRQRKKAAVMLKELLYDGMLRKNAIKQVCSEFGVDRSTLYRWCARFGVRTK